MLKALEIVGFKSFADRTRFEFRPGITAIVGPNGSGKSNVVDAIKWVLGEQSIKNLRGKEMTDVIFNGSATRRPLNFAEITITLDNSRGILPIDTPEVHITRRLYRSGESEYLINRQPCRLRDIRDLLAGTGLATQAYSVIEQGKIDQLLQATPLERRAVFEEAAGISRFKSRKLEAQRRLERLEQNLVRLRDIVEEVESRLRVVRSQAGKAQRYQKYAEELRSLRIHLARLDWQKFNQELARLEEQENRLAGLQADLSAQCEHLEQELATAEDLQSRCDEQLSTLQKALSVNREQIAAAEAELEHEHTRSRELERELTRLRKSLAGLTLRAEDVETQRHSLAEALAAAESQYRDLVRQIAEGERLLTERLEVLDRRRTEYEELRARHWELLQKSLAADAEARQHEGQLQVHAATIQRLQQERERLQQVITDLGQEHEAVRRRHENVLRELEDIQHGIHLATERRDQCREDCLRVQSELAELQERRTAARERARLLQEWEERLEGIDSGVKDFLQRMRQSGDGAAASLCGLVADLFQVELQVAFLVDAALGDAPQWVVLRDSRPFLEQLRQGNAGLTGRVGVFCLDRLEPAAAASSHEAVARELAAVPGVLGNAEQFVMVPEEILPLRRLLLGNVWFVESLETGLELARRYPQSRFVTMAGEVVTSDGLVIAGPKSAVTGLISRRSELRSLLRALAEWEQTAGKLEAHLQETRRAWEEAETHLNELTEQRRRLADKLREIEQQERQLQRRTEESTQRWQSIESEFAELDQACEKLRQSRDAAVQAKGDYENAARQIEQDLARLGEEISRLENDVQEHHGLLTALKVELAKSEERLQALRHELRRQEQAAQERLKELADLQLRFSETETAWRQSQRKILSVEMTLAELYSAKDGLTLALHQAGEEREAVHKQRQALQHRLQETRRRLKETEEQRHKIDLELNSIRHEKATLLQRAEEDYNISLAEIDQPASPEETRDRAEIAAAIDDLRRKIHYLGNVNLEALEELRELEERYNTLSSQYQDLVSAKAALLRIIERINADSRRLFAATLQTVSEHFAMLFRELFGGGQASIELEEGVDILESGIEIIARPPGKEPRNISLLSGGEKSLTCVALLLAIFRSRPSPFCVLDEVDAALDEANIDRFTRVLREFLSLTQFVIVTHSKRTVTCADTIYGITMEESGVSKRVSVRFEDLSDNGEILSTAPARSESSRTQEKAA
ncbi:chromosome segregation protein SMC [Thermogutta terrifontis]|nr:chromosome segregation protein SMC [Thermogutta terrifontis]